MFDTEIPELLLFMRRVGPHHEDQMRAIAEHTKESYTIRLEFTPPEITSYQALDAVLKRATSRYVVIMDDDLLPLDDYWLSTVLEPLKKFPDVAMVIPWETKEKHIAEGWQKDGIKVFPNPPQAVLSINRMAGYCMAVDRQRVPGLYSDLGFPHRWAGSDWDMQFQVLSAGFKVACTTKTLVYHPLKLTDQSWRDQFGFPSDQEFAGWTQDHRDFLLKKWGPMYEENQEFRVYEVLEARE